MALSLLLPQLGFAYLVASYSAPASTMLASPSSLATVARSAGSWMVAPTPSTERVAEPPVEDLAWRRTPDGLRYRVESSGSSGVVPQFGDCVSLHYNVRFSESGQMLGTSRKTRPLTFVLGKQEVPIFDDAVRGMAVGSSIRVIVPADKIPASQVRNVPKDQSGESLIFEIELLKIEGGPLAFAYSLLPPGQRRLTIMRTLFLLSFLPYFLPDDIKPEAFRFGDVDAIREARLERAETVSNSLWLGGAPTDLDVLFP